MNFGRLKARAVGEIGGYNTTDDATLLGELANEAVRDVLIKTAVKVTVQTVALTANEKDYTLSQSALLIKSAYISGERPLIQVSPDEIDWLRAYNNSTDSDTTRYALEGSDLFMVYPTPASAVTIYLRCVLKPTEMSSDAHDPSSATYGGIPVEFHPALLDYMCWRLASGDDDQSSAQGERYREQYERGLRDIRKRVNMKGNTRLPRAVVGSRRNIARPNDNGADW